MCFEGDSLYNKYYQPAKTLFFNAVINVSLVMN